MRKNFVLVPLIIAALALCAGIAASQNWLTDPQVTGSHSGYRSGLCYTTYTNGIIAFNEHFNNHKLVATYDPSTDIIHFASIDLKNEYLGAIRAALVNIFVVPQRNLEGMGSFGAVANNFLNG